MTITYSLSNSAEYGRVIIDRTSSATTTEAHKKIWRAVQKELKSEQGKALLKKLKTKGDIYVSASGAEGISLSLRGERSAHWSPTSKVLTLYDQNGKLLSAVINATEDMGKNIAKFFEQCRQFAYFKKITKAIKK